MQCTEYAHLSATLKNILSFLCMFKAIVNGQVHHTFVNKKSVHIADDSPKVGVRKKELQSLLLIRIVDPDPFGTLYPDPQ